MFKRNAMGNTRTKFIAGAVLLALGLASGSAMATNVYGGGATLPAGAYVGFGFLTSTNTKLSNNTTGGQNNILSTSLFGAGKGTGNATSYCQTGSGGGKKIFDHADSNPVTTVYSGTNPCTGAASATEGFGASSSAAIDPHFVGSDAPFSQSEFDWYRAGNKSAAGHQPVQFPAVIGSIAIAYNKPGVTLDLTEAQVCGIFNHTITQWSQLDPTATGAINVVYRSDGSGTSFSLANHLAAVCGGSATAHFIADQSFATVVSQFGTPASFGWVGASGNPGVVNAVNTTAGTITYAEAANLKAAPSANVKVAKVNHFDPYEDLPNDLSLAVSSERVITGANATTGRPVTAPVTASGYTPVTQCLNIVEPALYATNTTRYSLLAVSYLIANNAGNGADVAAVRSLIGSPYNTALRSSVTTIGNGAGTADGTGYAYINPTVTSGAPSLADRVNSCIN
ncbi:ABC-type phosphate transport system substrate-binding protein [Luteibacter sp. 1214]|uniref:substrate-binding domain-containing protein n=1 Tax=Luteibacter sp. 1214 TaxID=2817735 RepID=UPI00285D7BA1|nr:substrate-binding domain-containing protein [Luteibacter sp. 1214]MDR6644713.1 ABC-type phosphate transport system substrate-binding protein [Luteibacter sp. 1214]